MAVYVGDLLTASAAPVSGKPTPTRTWQWLRGSTAISGATSSTYTAVEADLGETLSVKQIETNIAGSAEATSLTVGPVETFTVAQLFASGEEGAWYEPSTTTAFSDLEGFNLATYGQGVAHLVDKSKGATIEARRNLLINTENFVPATSNWEVFNLSSTNPTVLANQDGDADRVTFGTIDATGDLSILRYPVETLTTAGPTYTISVELKANDAAQIGKTVFFYQNDATGLLTYTAHTLTSEYVRISVTGTWASTTRFISLATDGGSRFGNEGALTDTNAVALVRSIQLETGATATAYQKITTGQTLSWLPGNHATQVTAGARPILARVPEGGRRNLLQRTEEFDNAYWTKSELLAFGSGSVANTTATTDPIGGNSAELIVENTNTGNHQVARSYTNSLTTVTVSVYVKAASGSRFIGVTPVNSSVAGNNRVSVFDLSTEQYLGDVTAGSSLVGTNSNQTITAGDNGWYRLSVTANKNAGVAASFNVRLFDSFTANATLFGSYTGDGTSGVYLWGAQLETGSTATAYQKVVDEYDITEAGVTSLDYLSFNGASNGMATASIDFTATDKMSIFAGVERATDVNDGAEFLWELSSSVNTNTGSFYGDVNSSIPHDYGVLSRGSAAISNDQRAQANGQPLKCVLSALHDISGDSTVIRTNGAQISEATGDQGAGNFGNYPLNIGARNNAASVWFDGKIFGLIVRGASSTTQEISQTETYLAAKSGVTL